MSEITNANSEIVKSEPLFNPEDYKIEKLLAPNRTALLVVDPQNDFCHSEGFFAKGGPGTPRPVEQMADAVRQTKPLIEAAHKNGVQVIFTKGYEDVAMRGEAGRRRAVVWHEVDDQGREIPKDINSKKGTFGSEFFELEPDLDKGDIVIEKYDWSAFTGNDDKGRTLSEILKEKGITTIVATGVVAETCVETTIRDAHTKDFIVFVPEGCIGSDHPEQLAQRMQYWKEGFIAETSTKNEIEEIWNASPKDQ